MISETDLMWWCSLHRAFALTDIKSVCDLGQQDLAATDPQAFLRTAKRFAILCGEPDVDISNCRSSADMWRRLKRESVSLDLFGSDPGFLPFDLNTDAVPEALRGYFEFVTNVGTAEHVLNVLNVLRVMHDLTRPGGVMAHSVPAVGYCNHGFMNFNLKLFTKLAKANDYDCLDAWIALETHAHDMPQDVRAFLQGEPHFVKDVRSDPEHPFFYYGDLTSRYRVADGSIYVFLRRNSSAPFVVPIDEPDAYAGRSSIPTTCSSG